MLMVGQKFKVLVLGTLAAAGFSLFSSNAAFASDKAAPLSLFNKVEPHELPDVEVGVQNLEFVAGLAEAKNDEVQHLILSMQDAFENYASSHTILSSMGDELSAQKQNVALAFRAFDAAQAELQQLEVEVDKYEYAIEVLEFLAG